MEVLSAAHSCAFSALSLLLGEMFQLSLLFLSVLHSWLALGASTLYTSKMFGFDHFSIFNFYFI